MCARIRRGAHRLAVHIALAIDGAPVLGAVELPGLSVVMRSDQPVQAPPAPEKLRLVVSRTRPAREATEVAERIGAELVPLIALG
jgi:3'(2'), 5'-bisphosphate nucleotidase